MKYKKMLSSICGSKKLFYYPQLLTRNINTSLSTFGKIARAPKGRRERNFMKLSIHKKNTKATSQMSWCGNSKQAGGGDAIIRQMFLSAWRRGNLSQRKVHKGHYFCERHGVNQVTVNITIFTYRKDEGTA